ncbi:hypothetical protein [Vibrio nigripulchritudo]|nr:hypothetical protein [Vibrio nigripulchritudo]BDU36011.1 hypothetical protein TUMSATVNIG2_04800 [Vibrio nigripulchritudo]
MKKSILALTLSVISISTNASQFVSLVKIEKSQAIKTVVEKKLV